MKTILTIVSHFLPGYKAGGPIRSVANLIAWLGDEFHFDVLTRDRDLGDKKPYPGASPGTWNAVGKARVMYLSPGQLDPWRWKGLLRSLEYDVLLLNGFFERLSVQTLFLRRVGLAGWQPVILAPRGEFSPSALTLKPSKKRAYIRLAQMMGLWQNVIWLATSEVETQQIRLALGLGEDALNIHVAPNLVSPTAHRPSPAIARSKTPGDLRIGFVSRISRMKNLDYALGLLPGIVGNVVFDVYGPAEDKVYLEECKALTASLPSNTLVNYHGPISTENVSTVLSNAHLFLLPTRGENFGHVIQEALSAGCPVLISDRTPWRNLEQERAGFDLPLEQPDRFREILQFFVDMDEPTHQMWCAGAQAYMRNSQWLSAAVEQNRWLFYSAASMVNHL